MNVSKKFWIASLFVLFASSSLFAQSGKVLMFVSYEDTYYSEYIVMKEALEASGYEVEVRSAGPDSASVYMLPDGTDIGETANSLSGSSYAEFQAQFEELFGTEWNASMNETPEYIPVDGLIQDVEDMDGYFALVIVGGTGAIDYRFDDSYSIQGEGERQLSAATVQVAAEKLNTLAVEAIQRDMTLVAQCHGASLPVFWKVPGDDENAGTSMLHGAYATGFPEEETATVLEEYSVNYQPETRVVVSRPTTALNYVGITNKIITTRDWYPQTVAHAARAFKNIFDTRVITDSPIEVLIIHGGAINPDNCSASNRENDVPCNYGTGENLPADYVQIAGMLGVEYSNDDFIFNVEEINLLSGDLPASQSEWISYFSSYKVLIFFKHWSTGLSDDIQNVMVEFADNGGGVLGIHHGMYNDIDGPRDKNILANELFGAESTAAGWSANLTNYNLLAINQGHFITTYNINLEAASSTPSTWAENPLPDGANPSLSYYPSFQIYDEIYNNMSFVEGVEFGNGVGQITPILSNDLSPSSQAHTSGFVRLFNPSGDDTEGRVAYFEPGERRESFDEGFPYTQIIRNAVVWTANMPPFGLPVEDDNETPDSFKIDGFYPNPFNPNGKVEFTLPQSGLVEVDLFNIMGQKVSNVHSGVMNSGTHLMNVDGTNLSSGIYLLQIRFKNRAQFVKISLIK